MLLLCSLNAAIDLGQMSLWSFNYRKSVRSRHSFYAILLQPKSLWTKIFAGLNRWMLLTFLMVNRQQLSYDKLDSTCRRTDTQMTSPFSKFCFLSRKTNRFHIAVGLYSSLKDVKMWRKHRWHNRLHLVCHCFVLTTLWTSAVIYYWTEARLNWASYVAKK